MLGPINRKACSCVKVFTETRNTAFCVIWTSSTSAYSSLSSTQHLTSKVGVLHKQTLLLQLLNVKPSGKYTKHTNLFKKSYWYLQRMISENITQVLHPEPKGLPVIILYIRRYGSQSETTFVSLTGTCYAHKFGLAGGLKYPFYSSASVPQVFASADWTQTLTEISFVISSRNIKSNLCKSTTLYVFLEAFLITVWEPLSQWLLW